MSQRDLEVLACLSAGMTNKEIARHLGMSPRVVRNRLSLRIFPALGVNNRTSATVEAVRRGLVDIHAAA